MYFLSVSDVIPGPVAVPVGDSVGTPLAAIILVCIGAAGLLALWGGRRAANQFARKSGEIEEKYASIAALTRASLAEAEAERDKQAKLAQARLETLEGVLQEKQVVWVMYRDSTRQAGVAQDWLMREYSKALQSLNVYRLKAGAAEIKPPAQLEVLLADFGEVAAAIPDAPPDELGTSPKKLPAALPRG